MTAGNSGFPPVPARIWHAVRTATDPPTFLAIRRAGPAGALNAGGSSGVSSVSCGSAGNCAAGGLDEDGSRDDQGFVVSHT